MFVKAFCSIIALLGLSFGICVETPIKPPQTANLSQETPIEKEVETPKTMQITSETMQIASSTDHITELSKLVEIDYTKQCVYCARQLSPYQPIKSSLAKDISITMLEPRLDFWAIYDAGCQYGSAGHTGIVSYNINLDEGWFVEKGCNLDGKGGDYTRRVYYKGEKKDPCFLGFFGHQK